MKFVWRNLWMATYQFHTPSYQAIGINHSNPITIRLEFGYHRNTYFLLIAQLGSMRDIVSCNTNHKVEFIRCFHVFKVVCLKACSYGTGITGDAFTATFPACLKGMGKKKSRGGCGQKRRHVSSFKFIECLLHVSTCPEQQVQCCQFF